MNHKRGVIDALEGKEEIITLVHKFHKTITIFILHQINI